jgi:hypothetical protein
MYKIFCYVTIGGRRMLCSSKEARVFDIAEHLGVKHATVPYLASATILDTESGREWIIHQVHETREPTISEKAHADIVRSISIL